MLWCNKFLLLLEDAGKKVTRIFLSIWGLRQTQIPNGSNGADIMVRWVPWDPPHWQLVITTQPLIFFAIICRIFLQFNAVTTLIQGSPGRNRQIGVEGHHHTSIISLGNETKKEMDRALSREAKLVWAFSSTGTSQLPSCWQGLQAGAAAPRWGIWLPVAPSMALPKPLPQRTARSQQHELRVCWWRCPRLARPARSHFTHSLAQHLNWVELNTCLYMFDEQQAGQVTACTGRAGLEFFDVANSPQLQLRGTETSGKFEWTK